MSTVQGVQLDVEEEGAPYAKVTAVDSRVANPSIGELSLGASLSMGSGTHLDRYLNYGCIKFLYPPSPWGEGSW